MTVVHIYNLSTIIDLLEITVYRILTQEKYVIDGWVTCEFIESRNM